MQSFLFNILPIAWVYDAEINITELDADFSNHLADVKKGYEDMYPMIEFKGKINCNIKENRSITVSRSTSSAVFFSGGADAFHTLIAHIDEKPLLVTLYGADIHLKDAAGIANVREFVSKIGKRFSLENTGITTSFRNIINKNLLSVKVKESGDDWWHGFQCGIGLIGHVAPLVYLLGLKKIYIASSYSKHVQGQYTCASDPSIDNNVYFCGGRVYHDGYEYSRLEKVRDIVKYSQENNIRIPLRVCWESTGGYNCSKCEKCLRTIFAIIAEGGNPEEFGFTWNEKLKKMCRKNMKTQFIMTKMRIEVQWIPIQNRLCEQREKFDEYRWLMNLDFSNFNNMPIKRWKRSIPYRAWRKIRRKVSRLIEICMVKQQ